MAHLRQASMKGGRLSFLARDTELCAGAQLWATEHAGQKIAQRCELGELNGWAKAEPLAIHSALRHGLRLLILRRLLPRLAEYQNFEWLNARSFDVPVPFAAGVLWRGSSACWSTLEASF